MSAAALKVLWIYGLATVVSILMAVVIRCLVWLLNLASRPTVAAGTQSAAVPAPSALDLPPGHLAVISAAAYATVGAHRIVRVEDALRGAGWRALGRNAQHGSHVPQSRNTPR